jgi:hypothetical protein
MSPNALARQVRRKLPLLKVLPPAGDCIGSCCGALFPRRRGAIQSRGESVLLPVFMSSLLFASFWHRASLHEPSSLSRRWDDSTRRLGESVKPYPGSSPLTNKERLLAGPEKVEEKSTVSRVK